MRDMRHYDVESGDGTRIRAWTNDADGPLVLLCNGLGTNPACWPALTDPECGVRVVSWYHRGVGGSERPANRGHVGIDSMVEDALAVLATTGESRAVLAGWSMGVNTAFELAIRHPEVAQGIFAICGVPGGTFPTMLAPLGVPAVLRGPITKTLARTLSRTGRPLTPVFRAAMAVPWSEHAVRASRFIHPNADPTHVKDVLTQFAETDVAWFFHLARATARHRRVSLSQVSVPTTFVAATNDLLAGLAETRSAAGRVEGSRLVELAGSHFLMLERPHEVHAELLALVERATAAAT